MIDLRALGFVDEEITQLKDIAIRQGHSITWALDAVSHVASFGLLTKEVILECFTTASDMTVADKVIRLFIYWKIHDWKNQKAEFKIESYG